MMHDTYFVVAHFHYVLSMSATYRVVLGFLYWVRMFTFSERGRGVNIILFLVLFCGVNLVFFPMHEIGLDRLPRRYFSFVDAFGGMCILTILRILFTVGGWRALMILLMISTGSHRSISKVGEDWVYGNRLPIHTYIETSQNLLEMSPWSLCIAMSLVSLIVNFICIFRLQVMPWSSLGVCILVGYY